MMGIFFSSFLALTFVCGGEATVGENRSIATVDGARLVTGSGTSLRQKTESGETARATVGPSMYLVPVATVPPGLGTYDTNTVNLSNGPANVVLHGYFGGWGPRNLHSYNLALSVASLSSGMGASLDLGRIPCNVDEDCVSVLGITGFASGMACGEYAAGFCNPFFIDMGHPDFPNPDQALCRQEDAFCGGYDLAFGIPDSGKLYYGFSVVLHVPAGAAGTYEITFDEPDLMLTWIQVFDSTTIPPNPLLNIAPLGHANIQVALDDFCDGGANHRAPCSTHGECPGGFCRLKSRFVSL